MWLHVRTWSSRVPHINSTNLLVNGLRYTYNVNRVRQKPTVWQCTVHNQRLKCPATIKQTGSQFERETRHVHPSEPGAATCAKVKAKWRVEPARTFCTPQLSHSCLLRISLQSSKGYIHHTSKNMHLLWRLSACRVHEQDLVLQKYLHPPSCSIFSRVVRTNNDIEGRNHCLNQELVNRTPSYKYIILLIYMTSDLSDHKNLELH